jgi:hypothetical protein
MKGRVGGTFGFDYLRAQDRKPFELECDIDASNEELHEIHTMRVRHHGGCVEG